MRFVFGPSNMCLNAQLQRIHIAHRGCASSIRRRPKISWLTGCLFCGYFGAENWKNIANTPAPIACDTQLNAEQYESLKIIAKIDIRKV